MQLTKTSEASQVEELKSEIGILKQELEKSKRSEEELSRLIESANSLIMRWNTNGMLTFVNEYALDFFGYTREEMIGKSVMMIVPETETSGRDLTRLMDEIISEPEKFIRFENENIKKNGDHAWISWTNRAIKDESGKVLEIVAIGNDITERKKTEDNLLIEQNILQAVIGNIGTGFVVADTRGNLLSMNESALLMHGFANSQEMFSRLEQYTREFELKYPDGRKVPLDMWPLALSLKGQFIKDYEVRLRNINANQYRNIIYNTVPVYGSGNQPMLIVITMTDLTDTYERTAALKESQQRYLSLFNNSTMGITHCRIIQGDDGEAIDYEVLQVNEAFTKITGLRKDEAEGKTARELFPGIENFSFDYIRSLGRVAVEGGDFSHEVFFEALNKWLSLYVYSPKKNEFTAFLSDITDRKLIEEEALAKAIEIEAILSCIADGVIVYDKNGRITRSNDAANVILKLGEDEKKMSIDERVNNRYEVKTEDGQLLDPKEMPAYRAAVNAEIIRNKSLQIRTGNSEPYWIIMSAAPLIVSGIHAGGVISMSDITDRKITEEILRKNEQRLRAMFNNVAIGIVEVDSDDHIISVNNRTCEILGGTPADLMGKTVSEITAPEDRTMSDDMNSRLHRGDFDVFDYEKRYLKSGGGTIWVHVTVSAVRNLEGKHVNSIATLEDISERKKFEEALKENQRRLQVIFENAAIGIAEVDVEDRFIAVNNQICDILGYTRDELLHKTVHEITAPEDLPHSHEMNMKLQSGETDMFDAEKRYIKHDGSLIWVHVSASAVRDANGKHIRTIRTVEDISEKKKIEMEIRQKNEELTRFIYTVSHDLRSPLVTIKSFASFLKESIENNDLETQEKDISYIQNAADKMGRLLDELLELSRVGRKENPKTKTPLKDIAQSAIDLVAGRIENRGIKVIVTGLPVLLYGHSQRLVQLYQNLIDNAAKFIGDQAEPVIEIGAFSDEHRNNETVMYVRDNGSGIDPRYSNKIFGLFEKLNDTEEGTGIGLALVKRIVEVHGGSVWFFSEGTGRGTTFYFTLEGTEIIKNQLKNE